MILEIHGVYGSAGDSVTERGPVRLVEQLGSIRLVVPTKEVGMTPDEARYLARQLNRLAKRVDAQV